MFRLCTLPILLLLSATVALAGLTLPPLDKGSRKSGTGSTGGDLIIFDLVNGATCEWDGTGTPELAYSVHYGDGQANGTGGHNHDDDGGDTLILDIVDSAMCNGAGAPNHAAVVADLTLYEAGSGGGVVFDLVDAVVYDIDGSPVQVLTEEGIESPRGDLRCTFEQNGLFEELRDADGAVLYSALGPWIFTGRPALDGLEAIDQHRELTARLRYSFEGDAVVEGFAPTGPTVAGASELVDRAWPQRKLIVAALLDGTCGSPGL